MSSFIKFGLTSIALLMVVGVMNVGKANAQQGVIINEILKRMEIHRSKLTSLKTNIKMVKTDVLVNESETSEGTAYYVPGQGRDALIRVDWTKPREETLSVVGQKYTLYTRVLERAYTGNSSDAKGRGSANNLFAFLTMSKNEIKSNYDLTYVGEENVAGNIATWHLVMTPKSKSQYKSAEVWVDGNGMPIQVKVTASNNDTTVVLLSGLQKNITMNAKMFTVELPRGTRIIKG